MYLYMRMEQRCPNTAKQSTATIMNPNTELVFQRFFVYHNFRYLAADRSFFIKLPRLEDWYENFTKTPTIKLVSIYFNMRSISRVLLLKRSLYYQKNYAHDSNFFLFCCVLVHFDICLTLQWRHKRRDSVSNHQPRECLLSRLIGQRSKKTSKPRATGLCAGNSPETGEFPAQRAGNAENVSIWWRHHEAPSLEFTRLPRCQWYIPEKYGYLNHEVTKN